MTPVRATYRLQFTADFTFADGTALVPYLKELGISHLYASPVFAARSGSTHGYDITDYNRLNPALGTEADFRAMADALHQAGMGLILDFVPNHMGIGGSDNAFWDSVMEWGQDSPYAHWFDIDWQAPGMEGKVLFPFLGEAYARVLQDDGLELKLGEDGRLAIWAHGTHRLPICPRDYHDVLKTAGAEMAGDFAHLAEAEAVDPRWSDLFTRLAGTEVDLSPWRDPVMLEALIARQHWRAAKFNLDADAINYRRFFTISDLAGVRVERAEVFEETHKLVLSLLRDGTVDGLRIDHIDGLRDPKGYCLMLREAAGRPFPLYVEKILGPEEHLPQSWQSDGTTGYEFGNEIVTLLADPAGTEALTRIYHDFTGRTAPPAEVVHEGKLAVLDGPMRAEMEAVTARVAGLARLVPEWGDLGRGTIRAALAQVIAALDIYRAYADADGVSPGDRARITSAIGAAKTRAPEIDPAAWALVGDVLTLDLSARLKGHEAEVLEAAARFQQLSGPVMAKGLEDRALYRFNRLIALNEVGSHPGHFQTPVASFHTAQATRLREAPRNMLGTSSHDTKRGEDARMRIVAISSHTELWRQKLAEWHGLLHDPAAPVDANEEYFFYQLLLGAWPEAEGDEFESRVTEAMLKSVREAGANTRWVFGDEGYEERIRKLVGRALRSSEFRSAFGDFARRLAADAEGASLIQTALKLTVPGVPDIYQGAEMWELSLVDPDNRRPVDFTARQQALREVLEGPVAPEGRSGDKVKLALTARLLRLRAAMPEVFAQGSYEPVPAEGPAAESCLGFIRRDGGRMLFVAARLHASAEAGALSETTFQLPRGAGGVWRDLLAAAPAGQPGSAAELFETLPLAVLLSE